MPQTNAPPAKRKFGTPAQFWLHDEDRRILRELAAWLSGQELRLTDSMVIRAALRTAKTGDELLQACRQAGEADGRFKRHKSAEPGEGEGAQPDGRPAGAPN